MVAETILEAFDRQVRRTGVDEDGLYVGDGWSAVLWPPADLDRALARLRELPGHVEWKWYSHDPPGLRERLLAEGFEPDDEEAVLVAEAAAIPAPEHETRVDAEAFLHVIGEVFDRVYDIPKEAVPVVAFVDGEPASCGRVDLTPGIEFAGLFGGATLPAFRGRGLYRATVAARAQLAREHGYRWLYVDALPTSRPILERLGFEQITTTVPFMPPTLPG
jgi:GNAT superfamily N-acetyltransferase